MKVFADRIKELREERGLSQSQLAKELGVTHTAIGLWEQCKRVPRADFIPKIATFFNVTSDYLLGLNDVE